MDSCAGKLIRSNHRLMGTYVQLMPRMVQRRMEEMESKAAAAAATSAAVETSTLEASPASETPVTSLEPPQLPPSVTEVAPEIHDLVLKSAGSAVPQEATSSGPSYTAGFPQLPESGVRIDSSGPDPASSAESVLIAAPAASTSEGFAGQERPSEAPPPSSH